MNNKKVIQYIKQIPALYTESSSPFWDDPHISKHMLAAHINKETDSASRKLDTIKKSVAWITDICGASGQKRVLDLGCGAGIYATLLSDKGFFVTGMDISKRSIVYAKKQAKKSKRKITYRHQNYLAMDAENEFDVITLIYCDFGVLSLKDRQIILQKIWRALKKDGLLIVDVFTSPFLEKFIEKETVMYQENGFWSAQQHIVIERNIVYQKTNNILEQYLVITEDDCHCYNIWNQIYTETTLKAELIKGGFSVVGIFDDVTGKSFTGEEETICVVAKKEECYDTVVDM